MSEKRSVPIRLIVYLSVLAIGILFCGLYWLKSLTERWNDVFMAVGASLVGAIILGALLDLANKLKLKKEKQALVLELIQNCKDMNSEINQIYLKTKELDCFSFTSTNAKDLIIEATKLYRTLIDNGGYDETSRAHELRNQIYQIMNEQTMIEAVTKELLKSVDKICLFKSFLLVTGHLTQEEFKIFERLQIKANGFYKEFTTQEFIFLPFSKITFIEELNFIIEINGKRKVKKCHRCKYCSYYE